MTSKTSESNPQLPELPEIDQIDKMIHEPARLLMMAALFVVESADFLYLMRQTGLTFGNLSSHMSKLETAGFIEVKNSLSTRSRTRCCT